MGQILAVVCGMPSRDLELAHSERLSPFKDFQDFLTRISGGIRKWTFCGMSTVSIMHFLPPPSGAAGKGLPPQLSPCPQPASLFRHSWHLLPGIRKCSECVVATSVFQRLRPKRRRVRWEKRFWIKLSWEPLSTVASRMSSGPGSLPQRKMDPKLFTSSSQRVSS